MQSPDGIYEKQLDNDSYAPAKQFAFTATFPQSPSMPH